MCLPSGDHLALRSWTPGVSVRLRVGPSLAGTVKTSPRAPNRARLPSGEISKLVTFLLTSRSAAAAGGAVFEDADRHLARPSPSSRSKR